jgi:hypothetical protein
MRCEVTVLFVETCLMAHFQNMSVDNRVEWSTHSGEKYVYTVLATITVWGTVQTVVAVFLIYIPWVH